MIWFSFRCAFNSVSLENRKLVIHIDKWNFSANAFHQFRVDARCVCTVTSTQYQSHIFSWSISIVFGRFQYSFAHIVAAIHQKKKKLCQSRIKNGHMSAVRQWIREIGQKCMSMPVRAKTTSFRSSRKAKKAKKALNIIIDMCDVNGWMRIIINSANDTRERKKGTKAKTNINSCNTDSPRLSLCARVAHNLFIEFFSACCRHYSFVFYSKLCDDNCCKLNGMKLIKRSINQPKYTACMNVSCIRYANRGKNRTID